MIVDSFPHIIQQKFEFILSDKKITRIFKTLVKKAILRSRKFTKNTNFSLLTLFFTLKERSLVNEFFFIERPCH